MVRLHLPGRATRRFSLGPFQKGLGMEKGWASGETGEAEAGPGSRGGGGDSVSGPQGYDCTHLVSFHRGWALPSRNLQSR